MKTVGLFFRKDGHLFMKRKEIVRILTVSVASLPILSVLILSASMVLPVSADEINATGTKHDRIEVNMGQSDGNTTNKTPKKGSDGKIIYADPSLDGGYTYDSTKGTHDQQAKTDSPWYLIRNTTVSTEGQFVDRDYTYTAEEPVPYDESKWVSSPIVIRAKDDDKLLQKPDFLGSGVQKQLITREGQTGHSESGDLASLHKGWNGSDWDPQSIANSIGNTGTTATDTVEGAVEWKVWTADNLYEGKKLYPENFGYPYAPHYTAENHTLKYDKTKPVVSALNITQTRFSDLTDMNSKSIASQTRNSQYGDNRTIKSDQDYAKELDQKMTTTIQLTVTDKNSQAFHNDRDVSGIQNILVRIQGNHGKTKTLTYQNGQSSDLTRTGGQKNREGSADAYATYTWTGNLYKDPALTGETDLTVSVEVTDQAGNQQTDVKNDVITNNHPGDDIGHNSNGNKTHIRNFDAVSSIYRNDSLNEKLNGAYVTPHSNAYAGTIWNNYGSYDAFFKANYNVFQYGEFATVKSISYGSSVTGYGTDFDYGNANMNALVLKKRTLYTQSPLIDRTFGEQDGSEAGHTVSTTIGATKILTYNTRFPIVSASDGITKGKKDYKYALDLTINSSGETATEKAYRTPGYHIYYKWKPNEPPDLRVRISTNHGNGTLQYK